MDLDTNWVPVIMFLSLAFAVVGVTKAISDGRTRRLLIQTGASPEVAALVVSPARNDPSRLSTLKWGLVIGAIGIALIVSQFLPYEPDDPIFTGIVLLFGSIGLLTFYAITASRKGED